MGRGHVDEIRQYVTPQELVDSFTLLPDEQGLLANKSGVKAEKAFLLKYDYFHCEQILTLKMRERDAHYEKHSGSAASSGVGAMLVRIVCPAAGHISLGAACMRGPSNPRSAWY